MSAQRQIETVIFKSNVVEIYAYSSTQYAVAIRRQGRYAQELNYLLKAYPADYRFGQLDEPIFRFKVDRLAEVCKVLNVKLAVSSHHLNKGLPDDSMTGESW